jgi:hypothetical protein
MTAPSASSTPQPLSAINEPDAYIAGLKATAFWLRYVDLCLKEFPDVRIRQLPEVGSSDEPKPKFLVNMLPTGVRLVHKALDGHVDLSLRKRSVREVVQKLGDTLPPDLNICSTRRSAIIRAKVPRLVFTAPFDAQIEEVRASLQAVRRLAEFWPEVRRRMGYEPPLTLLQEPLGHIPKPASNLLHSRRFFRK